MSISNAEHIEEILHEAHAYGIRLEVIQLASKLREDDKSLSQLDSHQIAFTQLLDALWDKKKYKVMLVSGGFDPVHKGHLEMIEKAEKMAEEVWVILNNDFWLTQKKGKPFMKENEREYIMSRIKGVTKTLICNPRTPSDKSVIDGIYSAINIYRREYDGELSMAFGNGGDRGKGNVPEEDYCNSMGVDMVWNLGDKVQSSSWLIEKATNSAYSSSNG